MKIFLNKLLCLLLGHKKLPFMTSEEDRPFILEDVSANIDGFRYSQKTSVCPRCIAFTTKKIYDEKSWNIILSEQLKNDEERLRSEVDKIMAAIDPPAEKPVIKFFSFKNDVAVDDDTDDEFDENGNLIIRHGKIIN